MRQILRMYYREMHGIFLVYDITNMTSLHELDGWLNDIKNEVCIPNIFDNKAKVNFLYKLYSRLRIQNRCVVQLSY